MSLISRLLYNTKRILWTILVGTLILFSLTLGALIFVVFAAVVIPYMLAYHAYMFYNGTKLKGTK